MAIWAPSNIAFGFIVLLSVLAVIGAVGVVWLKMPREIPPNPPLEKGGIGVPFFKLFTLFTSQILFLILSFILFFTLEQQSRINPRIQALELGQLLSVLKEQPLLLGFFPWLIYAILGIGIAYFYLVLNRQPSFANVILPNHSKQPELFFYYYISLVNYSVVMFPILFVTAIASIWICETVTLYFQWPSLFETPGKTLVISAILLVAGQKWNRKIVEWSKNKNMPLGAVLIVYVLFFSFFLLWMHAFTVWFYKGAEHLTLTQTNKSTFVGMFSNDALETRMNLVIWGWWGVCIPWMSTLIARISMQLQWKPWKMLFISMIVPSIMFGLMYHCDVKDLNLIFEKLYALSKTTAYSLGVSVFLLLISGLIWGRVHNTSDLERGFLSSNIQFRSRPLTKWIEIFLITFNFIIIAICISGWFPIQVIGTLGTGFMTTVVFGFVIVLFEGVRSKKATSNII